jgi:hypothetical protein
MRFARISGGAVHEVIEAPDQETLSSLFTAELAATFVACDERVAERWTYADGVFSPPAAAAAASQWYVPKLTLVDRLIAAGKAEEAMAALNADPIAKLRWDAATEISSADTTVISFLTAIGAKPDEILAQS